jgi:NDP-sugar pyrophosphorylase family protein
MSDCIIEANVKIRNSIIAFNSKISSTKSHNEKVFLLGEGTQVLI